MLSEAVIAILAPVCTSILVAIGVGAWKVYRFSKQIHHQVFPNNGGSMFDKLTDIANAVAAGDAKFKAYQDADEVMTFEADAQGRITWTNTGIEKLFRCSPEEMLGLNWINRVVRDEQDAVARHWENCVRTRRGFDLNVELHSGAYVHMIANPLGDGKSACFAGHCRPIEPPSVSPAVQGEMP